MLIVIDYSVIEELNSDSPHVKDIVASLVELALARRRGIHLLAASRQTLFFLKGYKRLGKPAQGVYRHLYSDFSDVAILLHTFSRRLQLTGNLISERRYNDGNCLVHSIPISRLTSLMLHERTVLLAENPIDCDLYVLAGRICLIQAKIGGVRIDADCRNGGGSTTSDVFGHLQQQQRNLCLCIVDSDKRCPTCPEGETARRVIAVNNPNSLTTELFILLVREAENLLSSDAISAVNGVDANAIQVLITLEEVEHETLKYIDLKEGLRLYDIIHMAHGTPLHDYWTRMLSSAPYPALLRHLSCSTHKHTCTKRAECTCIIAHGFGQKILHSVHESVLVRSSTHKIRELLPSSLEVEWGEIGEIVAAWCCASPVLST